jgi:hypothetical protein
MAVLNLHLKTLPILVALLFAAFHVQAGQRIEITASLDNTLYESSTVNQSNGVGDYFFVGKTNQGLRRRALIFFDLARQIPINAVIDSVNLILHVSRTTSDTMTISLHRVLAQWGEGNSNAIGQEGSGAEAQVGDATWIYSQYSSIKWSAGGGEYNAIPIARQVVGDVGFYQWRSSTKMVSDVQSWLAEPAMNFGWLLRGDESKSASTKRFDSRQNVNTSLRPMLVVFYSLPTLAVTSDQHESMQMTFAGYPNPFNQSITLRYAIYRPARVLLQIFDITGAELITIEDRWSNAGDYIIRWDGRDRKGRNVPSGTYYAVLQADELRSLSKMLLLR